MAILIGADSTSSTVFLGSGSAPGMLWKQTGQAAASDGTVTAMSVHMKTARGFDYALGIYNSAKDTLLAYTSSFTGVDDTTHSANLVTPLSVTSGTTYVLALYCSGGYIEIYTDGTSATGTDINNGSGTFPTFTATLSATNSYGSQAIPSIWATGTAGGTGVALPWFTV